MVGKPLKIDCLGTAGDLESNSAPPDSFSLELQRAGHSTHSVIQVVLDESLVY